MKNFRKLVTVFLLVSFISFNSSVAMVFAEGNNDNQNQSENQQNDNQDKNKNEDKKQDENKQDDNKQEEQQTPQLNSNNNKDNAPSHDPEPTTATISASKVVCNSESDLPNWGAGGPDITSSTAADYVASHSNNCHLEPWTFQWAPNDASNPGDNVESASTPWTTFTSTAEIPAPYSVWVREEMKDGYVPFSGSSSDVSAEFYCNNDVLNYDNYDFISPVEAGHTYHCVGFNALSQHEDSPTLAVTATKIVCDSEADLPNWGTANTGVNGRPSKIDENTATTWLENHPNCHPQSGWSFQYGDQSTTAPSDTFIGVKDGYTEFGPTGEDGTTTVNVPLDGVTEVHLAEVQKEGYIPFDSEANNESSPSAEFYCDSYFYNYDNYEGLHDNEGNVITTPGTHHYCIAWNVATSHEEPQQCNPEVNLLENGDFEAPALSFGTWDIIADSNPLLKWLVSWTNPQTDGRLGLEIQNHVAGDPAGGNQHAELDGDHPVTIAQTVPTIIGKTYDLNFSYSARPGRNADDNKIEVKAGGNVLGAVLSNDGTSLLNTLWGIETRSFVATSTSTTIEFKDTGTDTSFGGYLDNVSLKCNPNPAPQCNEDASQEIVSDTTTTDEDGAAVALSYIHPAWTASIPGATWIWATNPVESPTNDADLTKTFTKTFNIVGTPTSGTLDIAADNSYTVKVNGTTVPVVFDNNNFQLATQDSYDVSSFLVTGANTLEIKVTNKEIGENADPANNPAGLLFKLTVHNDECVTPPTKKDGFIHIFKFVNGEQATAENTDGATFPMFNNRDVNTYTLSPVGWWGGNEDDHSDGDIPYEATAWEHGGGTYSTWENLDTNLVGESCDAENHPAYELVGYSSGTTKEEAMNAPKTLDKPSFVIDGNVYVIVWNHKCGGDSEPTTGSLEITKYVCPANTSVVRSVNGVGKTVPEGCSPLAGTEFGYVHGDQTDANGPYPELSESLTSGGTTGNDGKLTIGPVPATGRYLIKETDGTNLLGLYCEGDGDTSDNNDNQELTFVPAGGIAHCVAYNKTTNGGGDEETTTSHTTVVKDADMNGWTFINDQTDAPSTTGSFVNGPDTAPLGDGSAQLVLSNNTQGEYFGTAYSGTPLSSIKSLKYSTYRVSGDPATALSLQLNIDTDSTDLNLGWQGRLVYEPYYTQTVSTGVWQEWDALNDAAGTGTGNWWFSNGTIASNTGCTQADPCTWAEVLAALPNGAIHGTLGAVGFKAGSNWSAFVGSVDKFIMAVKTGLNTHTETYDFEPTNVQIDLPACSDGIDNDNDGKIDYPADPGCSNAEDNDETNPIVNNFSGPTGGGGGGGGKILGKVLGAETSCGIYVDKFVRRGYKNDVDTVKKIQKFLNDYMKAGIKEDGKYGKTTEAWVKKFQTKHSDKILSPWGFNGPTGIFYVTTQTAVNNIMCPDLNLGIPPLIPFETNPAAPKKEE